VEVEEGYKKKVQNEGHHGGFMAEKQKGQTFPFAKNEG